MGRVGARSIQARSCFALTVVAVLTSLAASCGGGTPEKPTPTATAPASSAPPSASAEPSASTSTPSPSPTALAKGVDAVVPTDLYPCASVEGGGFMWVTAFGSATVQKVDPATNEVVATFETDGQPCGVVFVGGFLWVGSVKGR